MGRMPLSLCERGANERSDVSGVCPIPTRTDQNLHTLPKRDEGCLGFSERRRKFRRAILCKDAESRSKFRLNCGVVRCT